MDSSYRDGYLSDFFFEQSAQNHLMDSSYRDGSLGDFFFEKSAQTAIPITTYGNNRTYFLSNFLCYSGNNNNKFIFYNTVV